MSEPHVVTARAQLVALRDRSRIPAAACGLIGLKIDRAGDDALLLEPGAQLDAASVRDTAHPPPAW